jgi:lipid-A-disaccharide synthase
MRYFLIAGEASGDMHAASLMKSIKIIDTEAEFQFWGGDKMQAVAPKGLLKNYTTYNVMGFVEVVMSLPKILRLIAECKKDILSFQPSVVILIDFPGFNLRIAEFCKKSSIKVAYYIAPKVWAWKEGRVKKLEQFVDILLLILPFEKNYFKKFNINSKYVGNPTHQEIATFKKDEQFTSQNHITKPVIALLPGSRKQELKYMMPLMSELTQLYPDYEFIVAGAPGLTLKDYQPYMTSNLKIIFGKTYDILSVSKAAVVCSGTATLETALLNVPQVCGYKGNAISYFIAKKLVKVKYISLVNLCMDKPIIAELIQDKWNIETLKLELDAIIEGGKKHEQMLHDYNNLRDVMESKDASKNAAVAILGML